MSEEGGTEDGLLTNLGHRGVSQVGHGENSGRGEKEVAVGGWGRRCRGWSSHKFRWRGRLSGGARCKKWERGKRGSGGWVVKEVQRMVFSQISVTGESPRWGRVKKSGRGEKWGEEGGVG